VITFATVGGSKPTAESSVNHDARYGNACAGDWLRARPALAAPATTPATRGQVSVFGDVAFNAARTGAVAVADDATTRRLLMTDVHIPTTAGLPAWSPPT
jgi:hypothetical protein